MIRLHASALPRVLACLGSTQFPHAPEIEESEAAREGTAAHYAGECALKGLPIPDVAPNGYAIDAEMREHAAGYTTGIPAVVQKWIETYCNWYATPTIEIGCKIDAAWLDGDTLHIRDYKYGWRIVEAEGNVQLIAYAVGLMRSIAKFKTEIVPNLRINLGIYQPRPYHPDGPLRTWEISLDELVWHHDQIIQRFNYLPSKSLSTGDHCEHCPGAILGTCPAYLAATANAVDVATRGGPMEVTPAQYARELVNLERAAKVLEQRQEWLKDIAKRAIKAGTVVPGWALEEQRGKTMWTIPPEQLTQLTNVDVFEPQKLCTPAEAKRRGVAEDVIATNTTRPRIGEKLVRRDPDAYVRKKVGGRKKNTP